MTNGTISHIRYFVLFQTIFVINRSFLLKNYALKFVSNILYTIIFVFNLSIIIYDEACKSNNVWYFYSIKTLAAFEVIYLNLSARKTKVFFKFLEELDDETGIRDEIKRVSNSALYLMALCLVSVFLDVIGMEIILLPKSVIIMGALAFCATDSELNLYYLITEIFNTQLAKLLESDPAVGSVIYKQLLCNAICFSHAFRDQTIILVAITILMSVIYAAISIVAQGLVVGLLRFFFFWRELRSLYSLWIFCREVERTKKLCERLQFRLGERLVFENLDVNLKVITRRWMQCISSIQLQRLIGGASIITPSLPFKILNWTFNYLIIIVQIYMAYK